MLISIGNMADLVRATGALTESEAVLGNAVGVPQEVLGNNHMSTLLITAKAARLQHGAHGKGMRNSPGGSRYGCVG